MPAAPSWYKHLPRIVEWLERNDGPPMERQIVQWLLTAHRRQAQRVMAAAGAVRQPGGAYTIDRAKLLSYLRRMGDGPGDRERARLEKLSRLFDSSTMAPRLLVEAPVNVASQRLASLPDGVDVGPGRIVVQFSEVEDGLQKLLALAMAIRNDFAAFDEQVKPRVLVAGR